MPVNCAVRAIGGYSAHADQPALVRWVKAARSYLKGGESCDYYKERPFADGLEQEMGHRLKKAFVVQGEEKASESLALALRDTLGVEALVPSADDKFTL